ncbi:MAG: hypothetical protein RLY86_276 [Pseudomonadota bacterium]|jgi:carbon-monoxide dehydrogenase large subunit
MVKFGIGQAVPRTEDARLLRGEGRYTDDLRLPGMAHTAIVRSPHAHAVIRGIDTADARAMPGVLAVFTAADLAAAGIGPIPCQVRLKNRDGTAMADKPRPVLAGDRVRHVGEPVAMVVAETARAARDGAEGVLVDYAPLPACTNLETALGESSAVHGDVAGNLCFDWEKGDRKAVDQAFARAARIVRLDVVNNRVIPNPMEGRACVAEPDGDTGRTRIWVTSQGVHSMQGLLAATFGEPKDRFHVLTTDVGGGFGMKMFCYPEYILAVFAARTLNRPVKWTAERTEGFVSDDHGRDNLAHAALALDGEGRFLGIAVDIRANMGAYLSNYAPFIPTEGQVRMLSGVYRMPAIVGRVRGVFTHTAPVDAYRGAGRPEAAYLLERLVDHAAREIGMDGAELRRRNMVPPEAMPYRTAIERVYDSGDFPGILDKALARADAAGFPARKAAARTAGKLRGLGIATYIEACAGGSPEQAVIQLHADGTATLLIGTQTNGQGHETAYKQVLADRLGLDPSLVTVVQGDSDRVTYGNGTGGSRSVPVGGAAVAAGAAALVAELRPAAAALLEVAPDDLDFTVDEAGGSFRVRGANRWIALAEVVARSPAGPDGIVFSARARWAPQAATYPNGCHVAEVEVDADTGVPTVLRYTVVDDFGTVMNPMMLAGQVQGGIAQGLGQALLERTVYDPDSGQLLTGSFMDYALPRADDLPMIDLTLAPVPCTTNALGMKGAGEAGSIGAPPALINALVDALAEFGVRHIDMPATPEVLWRLIHQNQAAA